MTGDVNQTTWTKTGNEYWTSTTSTDNYFSNYSGTRTNPWDGPFWHDSKEYKQLIKEGIVKALKASWILKNIRVKRKVIKKINRINKIRNTLPRKIRKD